MVKAKRQRKQWRKLDTEDVREHSNPLYIFNS